MKTVFTFLLLLQVLSEKGGQRNLHCGKSTLAYLSLGQGKTQQQDRFVVVCFKPFPSGCPGGVGTGDAQLYKEPRVQGYPADTA